MSLSPLVRAVFHLSWLFAALCFLSGSALAQTCVQPPVGIVSWWPGEGNAQDIIGPSDGTLQGGTTFAQGVVGQAFSFDGINDFVEVPDSPLWTFGANNFTIEMWVNFASVEPSTVDHPQVVFIGHDEGSGVLNKWTFAFGGGVLYWHINSPSLGPIFMVGAPFSPAVNHWYHLAVTRNGSTYTILVDGTPAGSETNTDAVPDADAPLTIGQSESPPEDFFMHGRIDEIAIYNRALSATQILTIVNAGSAGKCKDTEVVEVKIDIKPSSSSNSINPKSHGVIPVAILTTNTFDATTVDPLSARFGPKGAKEAHNKGHVEDVNHDGEPDLVLHFKTQDTGITCDDTAASLTGETVDGDPIQGSDPIKTVGCTR